MNYDEFLKQKEKIDKLSKDDQKEFGVTMRELDRILQGLR